MHCSHFLISFKQPSSLGYIIAGSFIKFLIDTYGIDTFKKLYADLDFKAHYGKELPELSREYETYLKDKFVIPTSASDRAKYYYGRKSIFYKVCPRYVAKKISEAWKSYDEKKISRSKSNI